MLTPHRPISRITLRQYKSIEVCDVELSRLTILVGRNGAGKSNIIDALAFVTDALRNTLEYAVRRRGGIAQVRRKSSSKPTFPAIALELQLPDGLTSRYAFRIAAVRDPLFRVDRESCVVRDPSGKELCAYETRDGEVVRWTHASQRLPVPEDRLYLVSVSGIPELRLVYDTLTRMVFHNLNPEAMKQPRRPEPGALLSHDGSNLPSVIKQLESLAPERLDRVLEYMHAIGVPIRSVSHKQAGSLETVEVLQERGTENRPVTFDAIALSDGTIRALGILISLVSVGPEGTGGPSLIGIEEPETALHPAAAAALMDALMEGSENTQLIVTCHSPDFLEHGSVHADLIRPVILTDGRTQVGVLAPQKAKLLRDHLATAGELLRLDQLEPDPDDISRQETAKGTLFEGNA